MRLLAAMAVGALWCIVAVFALGCVLFGCASAAQTASAVRAADALERMSHKDACTAKAEVVIDLSQNALEEPCEITAWRLAEFAKLDSDCTAFFGPDGPDLVELCK